MQSIPAFTLKKCEDLPYLTNNQLKHVLKVSKASFQLWKNTPLVDRLALGEKLVVALETNKNNLATSITKQMGKPLRESLAEIEKCIGLVHYYLTHTPTFLADKPIPFTTQKAITHYSPTGMIFGIMPWNFPLWQVFRYVIPNILAGNICLLKHAPNVFNIGILIEELFKTAGFPNYVFTNIIITTQQVEMVIKDPIVSGVCITGSEKAGKIVASLAGKHLKKSVLELGGNDAYVLLEDAPFTQAIDKLMAAKLFNNGQVCIAPKRIFVPHQQLLFCINTLQERINSLTYGNPLNQTIQQGPLAKTEFTHVLNEQIKNLEVKGGKCLLQKILEPPYFGITLLLCNTPKCIPTDEIFGPIFIVIPYKNEKELPTLVNQDRFGLACAIWSNNKQKALAFAKQIDVGYVSINNSVSSDPSLPFGGTKNSGYGKELGFDGFTTFLNQKTIVLS